MNVRTVARLGNTRRARRVNMHECGETTKCSGISISFSAYMVGDLWRTYAACQLFSLQAFYMGGRTARSNLRASLVFAPLASGRARHSLTDRGFAC